MVDVSRLLILLRDLCVTAIVASRIDRSLHPGSLRLSPGFLQDRIGKGSCMKHSVASTHRTAISRSSLPAQRRLEHRSGAARNTSRNELHRDDWKSGALTSARRGAAGAPAPEDRGMRRPLRCLEGRRRCARRAPLRGSHAPHVSRLGDGGVCRALGRGLGSGRRGCGRTRVGVTQRVSRATPLDERRWDDPDRPPDYNFEVTHVCCPPASFRATVAGVAALVGGPECDSGLDSHPFRRCNRSSPFRTRRRRAGGLACVRRAGGARAGARSRLEMPAAFEMPMMA